MQFRPSVVVAAGAFAAGLIGGMPVLGIVDTLGEAFVSNRLMTLFLITLPAIGLSEKYGLQEQAALFIRRFRAATIGRLLLLYQLFRILHGILGIRLNGHPVFVRPLLYPMAAAALGKKNDERVKAAAAASENYGNFYGQNLSPVQPGVLLVYSVLLGLGVEVSLWRIVLFALPITALSVLLGAIQFRWFGRHYE